MDSQSSALSMAQQKFLRAKGSARAVLRAGGLTSKRGLHLLLRWGLARLLCCITSQPQAPCLKHNHFTISQGSGGSTVWKGSAGGSGLRLVPRLPSHGGWHRGSRVLEEAGTDWASPSPVQSPVFPHGLVWASSWHGGFKCKFSASNLEAVSPFPSWPRYHAVSLLPCSMGDKPLTASRARGARRHPGRGAAASF